MRNPFLRLFCGIFVVELFILTVFSQYFGFFIAVVSSIVTSLIGLVIIRQQGLALLTKAVMEAQGHTAFSWHAFQSLRAVFAGFFLLLPGFATDILGVLIMLPWTSQAIKTAFSRLTQISRPRSKDAGSTVFENTGPIIDGEYKNLTPNKKDYTERKNP